MHVALVDAIAGQREQSAIDADRRAGGEIVREDVELGDHIVLPDQVCVAWVGLGFVGDRPVVFAVAEALGVEADHFGAVGNVVEPIALDIGGRANALLWPVVDAAGRKFGVGDLPQELAVGEIEGHDHAAVALVVGVALGLIVGADEDLVAVDQRAAVGLRAEGGAPQHVFAGVDVPGRGQVFFVRDLVAAGRAAPHRSLRGRGGGEGEHEDERCLFHCQTLILS